MKILVTGSNGLLGQKLVSLLQKDKQIHLIATARQASVLPIKKGEFLTLDITNNIDVENVISSTLPDVIINTAAMTQVDQCETERELCWTANVKSMEHLIASCTKHNIHLVHVSTDFIFDGTHGPLTEDENPNPVNYYGESKLAAEQLLIGSSLHWSILR